METKETIKQEYISRINKVRNYIEQHIDQPLTLNSIAEIACFSPYHFHRLFNLLTGETPLNFIQRLRVERAIYLLENNPRLSITEIATACGFSSLSLFSRTFRKAKGITAREFRHASRSSLSPEESRVNKYKNNIPGYKNKNKRELSG